MEVSRKTGHLLKELADDVAQLKESEKEIRAIVVCGTPAVRQVGKFVYDKSMPLNGIIERVSAGETSVTRESFMPWGQAVLIETCSFLYKR